ncbi:hypothetical protein ABS71_17115 [bacterium SCN 62-11]|nr:hypothetical protein [Candidatus Eremiobacteraeota bacterium]ODT60844.1 MAG: hypothetical protein ABS71_17115 [bacterium SCN 62-11]
MIVWLLGGLLAFSLVPPLLSHLSRLGEPPLVEGEWQVCSYSGGLVGCVSFVGVLFWLLVGFAYTHPGTTKPGQMLPALGLFSIFGLMGFYSAWQMSRTRVLWNHREFRSRGVRIPWEELEGASFSGTAQAFRLTGVKGQIIWVYQAMTGFPEFWKKAEEYLTRTD